MCLRDLQGATLQGAIKCEILCDTQNNMRETSKPLQLDAIDRLILEQLQADGKLSNVELAQRVHLESMNNALLGAFEQAVRDEPQVLDCYYVAGSNDYLIRFAYRDAEDLERFHTEVLMRLPGVERSNSMLVLRTVNKTTSLPL